MKAAALICRTVDGSLVSRVSDSVVPLNAVAAEVKAAGAIDGAPVVEGFILCSWRPYPTGRFRCVPAEPKRAPSRKAKA